MKNEILKYNHLYMLQMNYSDDKIIILSGLISRQ